MPLSQKEESIAKLIFHVNQLAPYPISDDQIESWSKSINELKPSLDLQILKRVIDKMKLGELEYDRNIGIQNIFNGLRSLERPMVY